MLVAILIVTNSFDEGVGLTAEELSALCTASPWLVVVGIMFIYCSLFTKLWRIDKVLQFRRRKVTIASVLWPAAAVFVVVIAILSAWTAVSGFEWVRVLEDPFTGATSAKCQGENSVAWFTPVVVLMMIPVGLTIAVTVKTSDIDEEYTETKYLFALILFQLQLVFITIPLFLLVEGMYSSIRYVVQSVAFFLFALSSPGFVLLPKIHRFYFPPKEGSTRGSHQGVRVSGVNLNSASKSAAYSSTESYKTPVSSNVEHTSNSEDPSHSAG
jgi:hypothetical protein